MKGRPILIVIAGPNLSGKTTLTNKLKKHFWWDNITYINPDAIAEKDFDGWNNKKSIIKAANYAQKIRENCIKNKENLAFETVFSTQEKVDFIQKAIDAGFFVRLFFVATNSPQINIERGVIRVLKGGHKVPLDKVISRYPKSIANCVKIINLVDRAYIYDNSIDSVNPKLIFRVANKDEKIVKQYEPMLDWTQLIYNTIS